MVLQIVKSIIETHVIVFPNRILINYTYTSNVHMIISITTSELLIIGIHLHSIINYSIGEYNQNTDDS